MKEQEIVDLLIQKSEIGLDELMKHYGPLMKYIIAPILPNLQDQEDCLSEVSILIWDKIDTYDSTRGSLNAWITSVTRHTALNHKRKSSHYHNEEINDSIPSNEPSPEDNIIRRERQAEVNRALLQLSQKEMILFYRKYYYLQSTAQIASEMGMTERAVEGKLYRLKRKLRKTLGGESK